MTASNVIWFKLYVVWTGLPACTINKLFAGWSLVVTCTTKEEGVPFFLPRAVFVCLQGQLQKQKIICSCVSKIFRDLLLFPRKKKEREKLSTFKNGLSYIFVLLLFPNDELAVSEKKCAILLGGFLCFRFCAPYKYIYRFFSLTHPLFVPKRWVIFFWHHE